MLAIALICITLNVINIDIEADILVNLTLHLLQH